jgi:hypothetical protein
MVYDPSSQQDGIGACRADLVSPAGKNDDEQRKTVQDSGNTQTHLNYVVYY